MSERKFKVVKTEEEWRELLSSDAFRVLRQHGTEPPFANEYDKLYTDGVYRCAGCGQPLFNSDTKFDSGSGWPSFYRPLERDVLGETVDNRFGMRRTEIHCSSCGGHIGHVFSDGPHPTGLRYCTNSAALKFEPGEKPQAE